MEARVPRDETHPGSRRGCLSSKPFGPGVSGKRVLRSISGFCKKIVIFIIPAIALATLHICLCSGTVGRLRTSKLTSAGFSEVLWLTSEKYV